MNINNKLLTYVFASVLIHALIVWLAIKYSPNFNIRDEEPKKPVLKSYLVFEKKQPEPKKQSLPELEPEQQAIDAEQIAETEPLTEPEQLSEVEAKQDITEPELVSSAPEVIQESSIPELPSPTTTQNRARSPYAAAQNYLNSLEQGEVSNLSQQSLTEFRKPKPLTQTFGQKSAEQYSQERSEAFAAKGSGVKVVAELGHGSTLVRVHGNCMMVKMEKGEQVWTGSNACGPYDPFKGQLQKSLNKYLKRGIVE